MKSEVDTNKDGQSGKPGLGMEKKKLLLVAVTVGVFLVIAAGAAILVFSPSGNPEVITDWRSPPGGVEQASRSATTNPTDLLNSEAMRGLQNSTGESPIQENTISTSGEPSEIAAKTGDSRAVITISRPQTAAVPDSAPEKPAPKPVVSAAPPVKKSSIPPKPAASVAPAKKISRDYWVQAGSYSTRDRADSVKTMLAGKGITAIITNQQISGQTYYRVRIGPYTTHNEANYWLAMIQSIEGFENSQVWESQSKQ